MIDLNLVATFVEAAKMGNLSTVAIKQRISPSAVSQKIKQLEDMIGKTLFIRKRTGVTLNRDGKEFLEVCENFCKGINCIDGWIAEKKGHKGGEISLMTTFRLLSYELPSFMRTFLMKYPDVFIKIKSVSSSAQVEENVLQGDSELGLVVGTCKKPSLKSVRLFAKNETFMVCSKDHPLAGKKSISKEDLANTRVIWHGNYTNRTFRETCKRIGLDLYYNSNKLALPDMEVCKKYVPEGIGIAFISEMYIREELKNGDIVVLPGFKLNQPIYLISRNEEYELPITTIFKKELIKYCATLSK